MRVRSLIVVAMLFFVACGGPLSGGNQSPPDKPTPSAPSPTTLFAKKLNEHGMWGWTVLFDATDNGRTPDLESVVPDPKTELHADKVNYAATAEYNEVLYTWFEDKLAPSTEYTITVTDTKNHLSLAFTTPTVYGHLEYTFVRSPLKWQGRRVGCRFTGTRNFLIYGGRVELGAKMSEDSGNLLIYDERGTYLRTFTVKYGGLVGQWELQGLDVVTGENITCENIL